jgi:hypothetical protein
MVLTGGSYELLSATDARNEASVMQHPAPVLGKGVFFLEHTRTFWRGNRKHV